MVAADVLNQKNMLYYILVNLYYITYLQTYIYTQKYHNLGIIHFYINPRTAIKDNADYGQQ